MSKGQRGSGLTGRLLSLCILLFVGFCIRENTFKTNHALVANAQATALNRNASDVTRSLHKTPANEKYITGCKELRKARHARVSPRKSVHKIAQRKHAEPL